MCGITGKFAFSQGKTVSRPLLERMCRSLSHRGPDDEGYYIKGPIGLGHRRLSIIDIASGHQPISNEDQTVWVVFNGEIYNYVELRQGLIDRGHRFETSTDTEVIVHLYEEMGEDFVTPLRGMFAIALWDERAHTLLLARDRVGKKPLFYTISPGQGLIFGSEIKAILQDPEVQRDLNPEALDSYLSLLYVPAPLTMFRGIQKLPAGHLLICNEDKVKVKEYWDLVYTPDPLENETECLQQLHAILKEAVRIRLRSDVPLGAFLSGGVDSSVVVSLMAEQLDRPVLTCSVGFYEQAHNELPYARAVAKRFHSDHREHVIEPVLKDLIPQLVRFFDEPFADSSAIPTYYVSQMARQHVTVALSGDGGDEVFAGYSRHYLQKLEHRLARILGAAGTTMLSQLAGFLPAMKGKNTLRKLGMSPDSACAWKHCGFLFADEDKHKLYDDDLGAACRHFDPAERFRSFYNRCSASDPLDKALYVDIKTYLTDDILVKVDRMSMAHALEVRAPLLDHKFLEFTTTLPASMKLKGSQTKVLLRRLIEGSIPPEVRDRKKHGFTMPLAEWLREPLREIVEDVMFSQRALERGLFNPQYIRSIWNGHLSGKQDYSHHIWMLLMFELWHREYLDSRA
ncbi:MAG: asparagine synthase (glutamine-hydrolyzing) [Nitrospiraceae bacterium]